MLDELTQKAARATDDPGWDEVRHERVLRGVMAALRDPTPGKVRRALPWLGAVAVTLALGWAMVGHLGSGDSPLVAEAVAPPADAPVGPSSPASRPSPEPASTAERPTDGDGVSVLVFEGGSRVLIHDRARIEIENESAEEIAVRQDRGTVRYEVNPRARQQFTVRARGVEIAVLGTIFTVDTTPERVGVSVERGRVRIVGGRRSLELGPGEELAVRPVDEDVAAPGEIASPPPGLHPRPAPSGSRSPRVVTSAADLLEQADEARTAGELTRSAERLQALIDTHPRDRRVPIALFSLGQVERARHRHAAAASAFFRCFERSGAGPLAEDALAEAAIAYAQAGQIERAGRQAEAYLARYPNGLHASRMRGLVP